MAFGLPSDGTRRLRVLLGILAVLSVFGALATVFVLTGGPYWRGWWFVAARLLVLSLPAGILFAAAIEWVIAGYRADPVVSRPATKAS